MHATFGAVTAADCTLKGLQGLAIAAVDSSSSFRLEIADAERLGRVFDGIEDVTAYVTGMKHSP